MYMDKQNQRHMDTYTDPYVCDYLYIRIHITYVFVYIYRLHAKILRSHYRHQGTKQLKT